MITTSDLIKALAANAVPVRRLRPPLARAALWLVLAALVLAIVGLVRGMRADLGEKARDPLFLLGVTAPLVTGLLAAIAAFMTSLPDRSRAWLALPAPALVLWLSTVGYGCVAAWVGLGPEGVRADALADCFATLVMTSMPAAVAMLVMLRNAAPLRPTAAAVMGGLAVGALAAAALPLVHTIDASIMILLWTTGVAALFAALGGVFGRRMLAPPSPHKRD